MTNEQIEQTMQLVNEYGQICERLGSCIHPYPRPEEENVFELQTKLQITLNKIEHLLTTSS